MRRERLSKLAKRLRYALLQNPALTPLPVCPRCGMSTKLADWSKREVCCTGCERDADPMMWDDIPGEFLPEEDL